MTKGILLMCFNSQTYGKFAYNMAHSIRHYSDLPIHLLCDERSISGIDLSIFSSYDLLEFEKDELGRIDNCLAKIKLFERTPFNKTLYLDVDGVVLNNPEKIFDTLKGEKIFVQPMGKGQKNDSITYSWAKNDIVWERYGLKDETVFNTCQTSIIYFNTDAEEFFIRLEENYKNRLDISEYSEYWGKSKQHPDELYYSITMAQMGIQPMEFRPVFFPEKIEDVSKIERDYFILSMYGGDNVKPYAKKHYDRLMQNILNPKSITHYFKIDKLYKNKFINIK